MTSRPDIVLLVLDTQRLDRLSCYGYPLETSPQLDAFASDATRFTQAISAAQWTVPSHTSMFTGLYPSAHNTLQAFSKLSTEIPTLAERLQESGYFTAAFCNNPLVGIANHGLRRGFQSFLNYSGLFTSRPNDAGMQRNLLDRYRQFFKGRVVDGMTTVQDAFARSDALLAFSFTPFMLPLWQTALSFKGNTSKSLRDAERVLIDRHEVADRQPVFCFINLMGTHVPYHPAPRALEKFAPHVRNNKEAQYYLRQFNSDVFGWLTPLTGALDEERKATLDGVYDAEVAGQDDQVGRFLARLRSSGALDHTLVIICADHGEHLGEKHFIGHTFSLYNQLVHVPLIIRDPDGGLQRGASVDHVVSTRRIFHTALTAARAADAAEERLTLAVSPSADRERDGVFSEATPIQNVLHLLQKRRPELIDELACDQTRRAVWSTTHKFIQTGTRRTELFSVFDDPEEQLDLSAILPEQAEAMQESLDTFLQHARHQPSAPSAAQVPVPVPNTGDTATSELDDPQVRRRLRDLGYLE